MSDIINIPDYLHSCPALQVAGREPKWSQLELIVAHSGDPTQCRWWTTQSGVIHNHLGGFFDNYVRIARDTISKSESARNLIRHTTASMVIINPRMMLLAIRPISDSLWNSKMVAVLDLADSPKYNWEISND